MRLPSGPFSGGFGLLTMSMMTRTGSLLPMLSWALPLRTEQLVRRRGHRDPRADGRHLVMASARTGLRLLVDRDALRTALVVGAVGGLLGVAVADPDLSRDEIALLRPCRRRPW